MHDGRRRTDDARDLFERDLPFGPKDYVIGNYHASPTIEIVGPLFGKIELQADGHGDLVLRECERDEGLAIGVFAELPAILVGARPLEPKSLPEPPLPSPELFAAPEPV